MTALETRGERDKVIEHKTAEKGGGSVLGKIFQQGRSVPPEP